MEDLEEINRELESQLREVDRKIKKTPLEYGEYYIVKDEKKKPENIAKPKRRSDVLAMIPKDSERYEINKEQLEKLKELLNSDDRYIDNGNGTITDKTTGLMWCLANSYLDLGRNINYTDAEKYVRELRAGGYSDWRIPTTVELAGIYANKPFFPNIGAKWYWSCDIYNSGWHTVVAVIQPENKENFSRKYAKQTDAGAVHAVRH